MATAIERIRPAATIAAAIATITASLSVLPLFDSGRWIVPTLLSVLLMAAVGAVARAVALPAPLQPILQLLALLTLLTIMFVQPAAALGIFPGPVALGELQELARVALTEAEAALAPVPTTDNLVFLAVGGIGLVALTVDTIGVTLRLPALAGVPLLLVFALPAAVVRGGVPWWLLPLAIIGWLLLMAADARDDARAWGPLMTRRTPARPDATSGPRSHPRARRPRAATAGAALQVALIAVVAALLLPTAIPGLTEPVWVSPTGDRPGIGGEGPISVDPFASLRRDLVDNPEREVLRYRTTSQAPGYLRLVSLDEFDGVTWRASAAPVRVPITDPLGPPDVSGVDRIRESTWDVRISDLDNAQLPVPYAGSAITSLGDPLDERWTWDPQTRTVGGVGVSSRDAAYSVASYDIDPTRADLRDAARRAPDPLLPLMQLPAELTPELTAIAEEVTAGAQTPYARAQALVDFFTEDGGFSYSTNVVTPPGADPLQSFLDERIGYCQQFAGTMALMARAVGIPSRVVVGFTGGRLTDDGEYVVQARNAHAWPELWFDGIGWVWFEPTPRIGAGVVQPDYSRDRADSNQAPDAPEPSQAPEPTTPDAAAALPGAGTSGPPALLILAALAGIVLLVALPSLVVAWRRRRRISLPDPRARIEATWRDLGDSITDLGWTWSSAATPREAANTLAKQVRLGEPERAALRRLVWWIEQVRYAPPSVDVVPPSPNELRDDLAVLRKAADRGAVRGRRIRARLAPASLIGAGLRDSAVEGGRVEQKV
jgi:transglutaminase-like putative cysteine protease